MAALIAQARSNRQIAEHLVLSERTVESHVRSILAKLGYSTRTEIATWSLRRQPGGGAMPGGAPSSDRLPPVHAPAAVAAWVMRSATTAGWET